MKKFNSILLISVTAILTILAGCASSGSGVSSNKTDNNTTNSERLSTVNVDNGTISLNDYLRRIPGVHVRGSGANTQIVVQGVSTFYGSTDPLFYIDETRIGRDFGQVRSIVNMHDVQSIKVFKGAEASAYGVEGSNGVIIIRTKKAG